MSDMKARQSLLVFLLYLEEKYHKNCCLCYIRNSPFVIARSIKSCLFGLFDRERSGEVYGFNKKQIYHSLSSPRKTEAHEFYDNDLPLNYLKK